MTPFEQEVLDAIKQLDGEAEEPHPHLFLGQVAAKLGREENDDELEAALSALASVGHIGVVYKTEQSINSFRLSY